MLKRSIGMVSLITCLVLITIPNVLAAERVITVSPTSETDAQVAINNAIDSVASEATSSKPGYVLLTAGTYKISAPIVLKPNVVLKGAGDSTIIFADGSVCNSKEETAYVFGSGVSNIEVCNLQFQSSAIDKDDGGHGDYRNCIQLRSSSNIAVHDILFTRYLYSDGVRVKGSTNITVYNCRFYSAGHDGVAFLSGSKNCRIYNCDLQVQTNTGIRVDNSENIEVDHNTFYTFQGSDDTGWCCVQLQNALTNVNVHHNIMHDFRGYEKSIGVGNVHASGSINVHDNVMWNVSSYMQIGDEDKNILGPSNQNVSNWVAKGYGYGSINVKSEIIPTSSTSSSDGNREDEQVTEKKESSNNSEKESTKSPGFEVCYSLLSLFAVFLHKRNWKGN